MFPCYIVSMSHNVERGTSGMETEARRNPIRGRPPIVTYCRSAVCPGRRKCKDCRNIYSKATRERHSEMTPEQRQRANARSYANVYQRRGLLVPKPCEDCGDPGVEKHHDDYSKPLEVRWFCRRCHLLRHTARAARDRVLDCLKAG